MILYFYNRKLEQIDVLVYQFSLSIFLLFFFLWFKNTLIDSYHIIILSFFSIFHGLTVFTFYMYPSFHLNISCLFTNVAVYFIHLSCLRTVVQKLFHTAVQIVSVPVLKLHAQYALQSWQMFSL